MGTKSFLDILRSMARGRQLPEHVMRWLRGEIDFAEFKAEDQVYMVKNGQIYASGSWWPRYLVDAGAVELVEHRDGDGDPYYSLSVVYIEEEVQDPEKPGKLKKVLVPHPVWRQFLLDEENNHNAIMRREVYTDAVAEYMDLEY